MATISVTMVVIVGWPAILFNVCAIIEFHAFFIYLCISRVAPIVVWILILREWIKVYEYQGEIKVSVASLMTTSGTDKLLVLIAYTIFDVYVL